MAEAYGSFNAGSITFRNDDRGRAALDWWRDRCLEWCFDRKEPGRWADQRYLDELQRLFPGVRVATHRGTALAPWNTHACGIASRNGTLVVDGVPAIFHHYQSLRLKREPALPLPVRWLPNTYRLQDGKQPLVAQHDSVYALSRSERRLLWEPYIERLERVLIDIEKLMPTYADGLPFLAAYHLAGLMLPSWLRIVLSRMRSALERTWATTRLGRDQRL